MHVPEPVFAAFNESQNGKSAEIRAVVDKHTEHEDVPSEFRLV